MEEEEELGPLGLWPEAEGVTGKRQRRGGAGVEGQEMEGSTGVC